MALPAVPEPFYWTQQSWGAALRCRALDPIAPHLFTTRQLQLSSPGAWRQAAEALGAIHIATLTQVHGRDVIVVDHSVAGDRPESWSRRDRGTGDALISDDPVTVIGVRAADCVPLLLADARTGAVGAVHAGWRGTAAGVTPSTVAAMVRQFGTAPADLVAAVGPHIAACCYEVGTELVDAFAAAGHPRYLVDRWFLAPPPARGTTARPTLRLDVAGANRDQLMLAGVLEENIHVSGLCTAMHLDVLTSFRMEKSGAGRIAGRIAGLIRSSPRPSPR